jgi:DNA polymerase III alpha subunit
LEDLKGRVEAILFSEVLAKYRPMLVPDTIVFLEGSVDRKREEPSLRVSRVVLTEDAPEAFASTLVLTVTGQTPLNDLVSVLQTHRGERRVYLNVESTEGFVAQMECGPPFRVRCSKELLGACAAVIGREGVCVLGPTRKAIPIAFPASPLPATPLQAIA